MARITVKHNLSNFGSYIPAHHRLKLSNFTSNALTNQENYNTESPENINIIISKAQSGKTDDEIYQSLIHDQACNTIPISHNLISQLLNRFKDDWKSALAIFKWAESNPNYTPSSSSYNAMLDILGKMKQMEKMMSLIEQMNHQNHVTIDSISKVMRRFCGAGKWQNAVMIFDDLDKFGLEKNTESMNILLDTLCKENKVEQARKIFLDLKSCIPPSAYTFNIFIHGWCKVKRVDEARWTIQEMKGYGFNPSVITYTTIIESYCRDLNFSKVYELLDEMQENGCVPNVVTFTTIMCYLTKNEEFNEALEIPERMKSIGCKPDTLFYNALIHTLAKTSRVEKAREIFEVEMVQFGVGPNTSTYNSMIAMFCHHGREQEALDVLKNMDLFRPEIRPDVHTFNPLLKLCFKTGKTDVLLGDLLDEMVNKYGISFDLSTYTLLIHGLCRSNKCDWAFRFFREMIEKDIKPRYYTCSLLLDEINKSNNNYVAADYIESYMKNMKSMKL